MPLTPPTPGLRRLFHDSKQPAKVGVIVPPGDELVVSDTVADQLVAASPHFKPADVAPPKAEAEPSGREGDAPVAPKARPAKKAAQRRS